MLELAISIYKNTSYDININTLYKDHILLICPNYGYVLEFISYDLRNDLRNDLQNDDKIVLLHINVCEYNLKHANERFKNNKELVLKAVEKNSYSLKYASNKLRNNKICTNTYELIDKYHKKAR